MTHEHAFDQGNAEMRARAIASANRSQAWIEEFDGKLQRLG
jgi:hypothetical protein